jgi:surfactin synthase thioesterase subunit
MTQHNQSEIARLKAQIEAEIQAAQWALYGASLGAAQHQFITCRMERMGMLHEELKELVGEEEGIRLLVQVMDSNSAANKLQRK